MTVRMINKLADVGEFGLIDRIARILNSGKGIMGIGDDTAVLPFSDSKYQLLTTDMLIEGVHFKKNINPFLVGQKAINCNISDIAAMGGTPKYAVVSVAFPKVTTVNYVEQLYKGMVKSAKKFNVKIVGGDTVNHTKIVINVALQGEVAKSNLVTRDKARVGHQIFVTGAVGNSLKSGRHLSFTPRIKESRYLVRNYKPSSMIDISDGLVADLGHILKRSKVGACINEENIPYYNGASLKNALYDGEDYELLFTLPRMQAVKLCKKRQHGYQFAHIGEIIPKGFKIRSGDGRTSEIAIAGYNHFKQ